MLCRSGRYLDARRRGVAFLVENFPKHIEDKDHGPRTRYATFALVAFSENQDVVDQAPVAECVRWLLAARNADSGWGTEASMEPSLVFPTATALWALQKAGCDEKLLESSFQWLLSRSMDRGWSLRPGQGPPAPLATGYAVLALALSKYKGHDRVQAGTSLLLQTQQWGIQQEDVTGALWKHSTFAWVLPALMVVGQDPYSPVVAEGIRYVNSLRSPHGGWYEEPGFGDRTVRGQFWAAMALGAVHDAFDPAVHVLRIDAERAQESLSEPDFVKIAVRSKWAVILPARLYRLSVYSLLALGILVLLGGHRIVAQLPRNMDLLVTIGLAVLFGYLVRKRPRQFPRVAPFLPWIVVVIEFVHLVFGVDVMAWLGDARSFLKRFCGG